MARNSESGNVSNEANKLLKGNIIKGNNKDHIEYHN